MDVFIAAMIGLAMGLAAGWVLWYPGSPANRDKEPYKPKGGGRGQK